MIATTTIAWIGGLLVTIFSFCFVRVLQLKIQAWNREKKSPLPLEGFFSIGTWVGTLSGLTIMFTGILETYTFSPANSIVASLILSITTGMPMWGVVKGLLKEIELGELKEIVPGKF